MTPLSPDTKPEPPLFKRRVYLDSETNGLILPTKIWCIVCEDIDTGEVFRFRPNSPLSGHEDFKDDFLAFLQTVSVIVGHNILGYDIPHIKRLLGTNALDGISFSDTLVLSRLFRPVPPQREVKGCYNRQWGHSLAAWGRYLDYPKGDFSDWTKYSELMLEYCIRDVKLGILIYQALMVESQPSAGNPGFSQQSIDLEHKVASLLHQQVENGFYLDQAKALDLKNKTDKLLEDMDEKLRRLFPPLPKLIRNLTLKRNKDGTLGKVSERILQTYQTKAGLKAVLKDDGSYDLFQDEIFNPQSGAQIAERLQGLGWVPKYFTDKGNVKTDKETINQAIQGLLEGSRGSPELKCLSEYGIIADRNNIASTWLELVNDPEGYNDGRVHGSIIPIGAGTHRCSHYSPNMANIARVVAAKRAPTVHNVISLRRFDKLDNGDVYLSHNDKEIEVAVTGLKGAFGWDCRECWSVPEGHTLVGADAAGIQLRALAHYMNDQKYTDALLREDIHVVHQKAAGISTRARAKTFIYSWLMGGGDEKIGSIVGIKEEEWDELFKWATDRKHWDGNYLDYVIDALRKKTRKADKKTVATVIKGFKTKEQFLNRTPALKKLKKEIIPAAAKAGYLIGLDGRKIWLPNEHLSMSIFLQSFEAIIIKQAMIFYSEELQSKDIYFKQCAMTHDEFSVETRPEFAEIVGQIIVRSIVRAGELYKTNCPLDGTYHVGRSWAEVH